MSETRRVFVIVEDNEDDMWQLKSVLRHHKYEWDWYRRHSETSEGFDHRKHAGLILLGGGGKKADQSESKWIKQASDGGIATLGICQGAQNIAEVFGQQLRRCKRPDQGLLPLHLTEDGKKDRVLRHLPDGQKMCQWHGWEYLLPDHAIDLVRSGAGDRSHSEAFRLGRRIYGLQFHPEVPSDEIPKWVKGTNKPNDIECKNVAKIGWDILEAWLLMVIGPDL